MYVCMYVFNNLTIYAYGLMVYGLMLLVTCNP